MSLSNNVNTDQLEVSFEAWQNLFAGHCARLLELNKKLKGELVLLRDQLQEHIKNTI